MDDTIEQLLIHRGRTLLRIQFPNDLQQNSLVLLEATSLNNADVVGFAPTVEVPEQDSD
jgi:hypothetical protein